MKAAHTGPPLVFERLPEGNPACLPAPPANSPFGCYCLLRFVSQSM